MIDAIGDIQFELLGIKVILFSWFIISVIIMAGVWRLGDVLQEIRNQIKKGK